MTTNVDRATRFLLSWTANETAAALALCHNDLHFKGPIDEWHTASDHLKALMGVARVVTDVKLHRAVEDGDDVVLIYDLITSTTVGTARIAEWKTFRGGKIAEIRAYFDSHPWRVAGFGN
jgi:ketosteroid isomerase-like protein